MKLSFLPAELFLTSTPDGVFVIRCQGEVVFTTRREKAAVKRFNELRSELQGSHPVAEISADEKARLLNKHIGEQLVDDNHYRPRRS